MQTYTPDELIAHAKAWMAAEAKRMSERPKGVTRSSWRAEHPVVLPRSFEAKVGRRSVTLAFDANGSPYDLWVWNRRGQVEERIDLRADDAAERLSRYEKA